MNYSGATTRRAVPEAARVWIHVKGVTQPPDCPSLSNDSHAMKSVTLPSLVFVLLAIAPASVCQAAYYELIYVKGSIGRPFEVCVDNKFKKSSDRSPKQDTLAFFSPKSITIPTGQTFLIG